jgi:hypothetical protein
MPYIPTARREVLDKYVEGLSNYIKETNLEGSWLGDANYVITRLLTRLIRTFGPIKYWQGVSVLGTLEAAKIEFYRRVMSPYENKQSGINGDVLEYAQADEDLVAEPVVTPKARGRFADEENAFGGVAPSSASVDESRP